LPGLQTAAAAGLAAVPARREAPGGAAAGLARALRPAARAAAAGGGTRPAGVPTIPRLLRPLFRRRRELLTALPLFAWLAGRRRAQWGLVVPVVAVAANPHLVRYAAELKPYSLDVLVASALLLLTEAASDSARARRALLVTAVLAPWISFPSVFVLAPVAAVLVSAAWRSGDRARLRGSALGVLAGGTSFAAAYLLAAHASAQSPWLLAFWRARGAFWPLVPPSGASLGWPFERLFALAKDPGGFTFAPLLAVALLATGAASLALHSRRLALLLLGPLALTLVASALEKYPIHGRLMLFMVPMTALLLGAGHVALAPPGAPAWRRGTAAVGVGLVLAAPALSSARRFLEPVPISDTRPVLESVAARRQEGDVLLVFPYALPAVTFYGPPLGLDPASVVLALRRPGEASPFAEGVDAIAPGSRVWFLMASVPDMDFTEEERQILEALDARGRRVETLRAAGAAAYLYELGPSPGRS
jgi:hypothetical protein